MDRTRLLFGVSICLGAALGAAWAATDPDARRGAAAFGGWRDDKPGAILRLTYPLPHVTPDPEIG